MRNLNVKLSLLPLALLVSSNAAFASPMTLISQERVISSNVTATDPAHGVNDGDFDMAIAQDFETFDESVTVLASAGDAFADAGSDQTSEISSSAISISGSFFTNGQSLNEEATAYSNANSTLIVIFTLDSDSHITLDIAFDMFDLAETEVTIEKDNHVVFTRTAGENEEINETYSTTLSSGEYTFIVAASGTSYAQNNASVASAGFYDLLFSVDVSCTGDLNGDGVTDQADLGILLSSYGIDTGGDLDGDGDTDQSDIGILLSDYGCGL